MPHYFSQKFEMFGQQEALCFKNQRHTYHDLLNEVTFCNKWLRDHRILPGDVVSLEGSYSLSIIAMWIALMENHNIIVPISQGAIHQQSAYLEEACVTIRIRQEPDGRLSILRQTTKQDAELIAKLRKQNVPGLILFSSGSTGKSKAIVHDLKQLAIRFIEIKKRASRRIILFLLYDHIGGINTLLYILATGSCLIIPEKNEPDAVCRCIESHRAQLLPTTPSFLNLLLLSEVHEKYDLSSLKFISYGTEPMPDTTLARLKNTFPNVRFIQTYGLSEVGILNPKANPHDTQWFKLDRDEVDYKIMDGQLWLKTSTNMLGYINEKNKITADGWFNTEDAVIEKDGYLRILGRTTELINVGGQKVFPQEIENIILNMEEIEDVLVLGESHPIVGQIVTARVVVKPPFTSLDDAQLRTRIRRHCHHTLEKFKVPAKIEIVEGPLITERFKKRRTNP